MRMALKRDRNTQHGYPPLAGGSTKQVYRYQEEGSTWSVYIAVAASEPDLQKEGSINPLNPNPIPLNPKPKKDPDKEPQQGQTG